MGLFDFLNNLGSLGSGMLNIHDFVNNVSGRRSVDAQKELQQNQYALQSDLINLQQQNNLDSMAKQQSYNVANMSLQQLYAKQNMGSQFAYNAALSNAARNIAAMRSAGLNPSQGVSTASSVGLPQSSIPGTQGIPSGSGSGIGMASVNPSRQIDLFDYVNSRIQHQNLLDDSQADINRTTNITQLAKQLADLDETRARREMYLKQAGYSDARIKEILNPISGTIAALKRRLDIEQQNADSQTEVAKAATKNAEVGEKRLSIEQQNADSEKRRVDAIWDKLPLEKREIEASIRELASRSGLNAAKANEARHNADFLDQKSSESDANERYIRKQAEFYADRILAEVDKDRSIAHAAEAQSKLTNKDVEYYEVKMYVHLGCKIASTLGEILPIKDVLKMLSKKYAKEADSKAMEKAAQELEDASNKSDSQIGSWIDEYLNNPDYSPGLPKE